MASPRTVRAFAPAKVNLTLHVTGQRADRYHLLDSLVVFANVGDSLTFRPASERRLMVRGEMSEGVPLDDSNLILQAAQLFPTDAGAEIVLDKVLPTAAGIGGGSSDAAAAIRGLSRLWGLDHPDTPAQLGADVPVCLRPKTQRMQGIGDVLSPASIPRLPAVLVNPGVSVPTGPVFEALASKTNAPMPEILPDLEDVASCAAWLGAQRNDLEDPARSLAPEIEEVLDVLTMAPANLLARMSGSGATCFGLFPDLATAQGAAAVIGRLHPLWWVQACELG